MTGSIALETLRVAFVEDDDVLRQANLQTLELAGFEPLPFESAEAALRHIDATFPGVVVSDIRMPRVSGLDLLQRLQALDPDLPVVLITGHADIAMAVDAMHAGAYDFLSKPYPAERLVGTVRRALEKRRLVLENRRLRADAEAAGDGLPLIGTTPAMERLRQTIRHIAQTDVDVLVYGETGTGKEVIANLLHRWSRRRDRAFVAINCGALPESMMESELFGHEVGAFTGAQKKRIGRIEHAHRGTLFLDELESMPLALQVKLLRVLETREVAPLGTNEIRALDLRIVAAVKGDLEEAARAGRFREDLYHRLNVVTIRLPPLRERRADIRLLFAHFLNEACRRFGRPLPALSGNVARHLDEHAWPGNVRELRHFAERVALGLEEPPTTPEESWSGDDSLPTRVERFEAEQIRAALTRCGGDVRATIELLGIPRKTFYDKLSRHGIERAEFVERKG